MAQEAITLTAEAFAWLVTEHKLQVEGPFDGYIYTGKRGRTAWELYKTEHTDAFNWDQIEPTLAATENPAAAADYAVITVPVGSKWLFLGFRGTFAADATVHSHFAYISVARDGTTADYVQFSAYTQPQSSTAAYTFAVGATSMAAAINQNVTVNLPANGIEIPAGGTITVAMVGNAGTDEWGVAQYAYKEADA